MSDTVVASWLRFFWPYNTAKAASSALDVDVRTVRGWLSGQMPSVGHLQTMADQWGLPFIADVFALELSTSDKLSARIDQLGEDIQALRKEIAQSAESIDPTVDRALEQAARHQALAKERMKRR